MGPSEDFGPTREGRDLPASAGRHNLSLLFCDLSESTRIAARLETEEYDQLLGVLRAVIVEAVGRHGGEIVRIDGDGVLAIFGYPKAHEDDGRRAVETAIDIRSAARTLGPETPGVVLGVRLHSGVHSGLVLVKEGDAVRGRYEMLGDATNIARRLADLAGPDEIIVSEASLGADLNFFDAGERRLETPRGWDAPIAVRRIFGRRADQTRFAARARRGLAHFAGRAEEMARLRARLAEVTGGGYRLAVVVGGPGVGKTRLANEFLARIEAENLSVHRAYCEAYLGARPLQPFLQIRQSALRQMADAGDPSTADPAAFAALLDTMTRAGPVVLFIDDWQWVDDASRRVLDSLSGIGNRGLFILLASRTFDVIEAHFNAADVVELPPLSLAESEAAAASMLYAAEPFVIERIGAVSGGNPLLLEELCHTHQRKDGQGRGGAGGAWLDMLIESRFARLAPSLARMVKAAAVVGHMIPAWLFEDLTGEAADGEALAALAADDFIYPSPVPGLLQFKHAITRDAIYALIGLEERRAGHRSVVHALRRRAQARGEAEPVEALAYHLGEAGETAEAVDYAERAGDAAMAASSLDRAQAQYRSALSALESLDPVTSAGGRWDKVARKFAEASGFDPSREQLPILLRARERALTRGATGDAVLADYWLGVLHYGLGECRPAIRYCQRALASTGDAPQSRLTVEIRAALGRAHAIACEYGPALALLDEAITAKRRRPLPNLDIGLVYSIACRAFLLADQGRFDEADKGFDEALSALDGAPHRVASSILSFRSAACLWQGRMEAARLYAEDSAQVAANVKARYIFAMARALGAYARWSQDHSAGALADLVEATAWLTASDSRQRVSMNHGWLAEAMADAGDLAKARHHAALALRRARQGDRLGEAMAFRALARSGARNGDRRAAAVYLARAESAAAARNSAHEAAKNQLCAAELGGDAAACIAAEDALVALDLGWFVRGSWRAGVSGRASTDVMAG